MNSTVTEVKVYNAFVNGKEVIIGNRSLFRDKKYRDKDSCGRQYTAT